jgi:hypothetical protein
VGGPIARPSSPGYSQPACSLQGCVTLQVTITRAFVKGKMRESRKIADVGPASDAVLVIHVEHQHCRRCARYHARMHHQRVNHAPQADATLAELAPATTWGENTISGPARRLKQAEEAYYDRTANIARLFGHNRSSPRLLSAMPSPRCATPVYAKPGGRTGIFRADLEVIYRCPNLQCNELFIAYFDEEPMAVSRPSFHRFKAQRPNEITRQEFSEYISKTSPSFCDIYNEDYKAERLGLTQICAWDTEKHSNF